MEEEGCLCVCVYVCMCVHVLWPSLHHAVHLRAVQKGLLCMDRGVYLKWRQCGSRSSHVVSATPFSLRFLPSSPNRARHFNELLFPSFSPFGHLSDTHPVLVVSSPPYSRFPAFTAHRECQAGGIRLAS